MKEKGTLTVEKAKQTLIIMWYWLAYAELAELLKERGRRNVHQYIRQESEYAKTIMIF